MSNAMDDVYRAAAEVHQRNESAALCTVVRSEGSTPRHVGSKMLVYPDGRFIGSVGGGELEHRVLDEAQMSLADGQPRLLHYSMADPSRGDPGVCGGQVEVFVEPIVRAPTLVVIGGGHVGKAVAHLAKWLNFQVVVSDDRPEYCNKETVPDADTFCVCAMEDLPSRLKIDTRTYLVLTTRGTSVDAAGLPALLETPAAYIGVIGSRRRWSMTLKEIEARGVSRSRLERVHSPVGLELHAETPEEIAISIMAEILMIRDRGTGRSMAGNRDEERDAREGRAAAKSAQQSSNAHRIRA